MEIKWKMDNLGSTQRANLGKGFRLIALYPLMKEHGHKGYVNGLEIGTFASQKICMDKCESVALKMIKLLYHEHILNKEESKMKLADPEQKTYCLCNYCQTKTFRKISPHLSGDYGHVVMHKNDCEYLKGIIANSIKV